MVSVIIPIYNAESSLRRCLDSLLTQTYQDWEALLVDDGCKDNSANIIDDYANQDARFKAIHQENAGPGAARNKGLDKAQGEFICFLDADDWVAPEWLQHYMEAFDDCDIVFSGWHRINEEEEAETVISDNCIANLKEKGTLIANLFDRDRFGWSWCKAVRRDVIERNHIRFEEDVMFREDALFAAECAAHCNRIKVTSHADYYYDAGNTSSLMHRELDPREYIKVNRLLYLRLMACSTDKVSQTHTDAWYIQQLYNLCKATFQKKRHAQFTDEERLHGISEFMEFRRCHSGLSVCYDRRFLPDLLLRLIWGTGNSKTIFRFMETVYHR